MNTKKRFHEKQGIHTAMKDYRTEFYTLYRSTHVKPRKGDVTVRSHAAKFPYWSFLLGPHLPASKNAQIVDLGCGSGAIVAWLHHIGYKNAFGVDVSIEEVEVAHALGLPVHSVEINSFLAQHKSAFDFVILRNVLEHFYKSEIIRLLKLTHQVLTDGGTIFIQVPNAESPFGSRIRYGDFTHETAFTATSMCQLLRVCGYHDIVVGPVQPRILRGRRLLLWKLIERLYKCLLYAEIGPNKYIVTQDLYAIAHR